MAALRESESVTSTSKNLALVSVRFHCISCKLDHLYLPVVA
jgi:hypothetical protein